MHWLDLSEADRQKYINIIQHIETHLPAQLEAVEQDWNVVFMDRLIVGSFSFGTATPTSDIDIIMVVNRRKQVDINQLVFQPIFNKMRYDCIIAEQPPYEPNIFILHPSEIYNVPNSPLGYSLVDNENLEDIPAVQAKYEGVNGVTFNG